MRIKNKENGVDIVKTLTFVWINHQRYLNLLSVSNGSKIDINYIGEDLGSDDIIGKLPSFKGAEITVDNTIYRGNVKIVSSLSQWPTYEEQCPNDKLKYDIIFTIDGGVPVNIDSDIVVIRAKLSEELLSKMWIISLEGGRQCAKYLAGESDISLFSLYQNLIFDRLVRKSKRFLDVHSFCDWDWNTTFNYAFFDTIAISTPNRESFNELAKRIYVDRIINNFSTLEECEALLFGTAGMLSNSDVNGEYVGRLREIFAFQKDRYKIREMNWRDWNYSSSSKGNSIYILIAQLAAYLFAKIRFTSVIEGEKSVKNLYRLMSRDSSTYWHTHTNFGENSLIISRSNIFSSEKMDVIIINAILPLIFAKRYSESTLDDQILNNIYDILSLLKPENNIIVKEWKKEGVEISCALESQAIIQLHKEGCVIADCGRCKLLSKMMYRSTY